MRSLLAALLLLAAAPAAAIPEDKAGRSGAPIPRFVSINATEANARAGPGEQYPVRWTYRRPGLPLEVIREWGPWRQVRDPLGGGGWMLKALLSGDRYLLVTGGTRSLHAEADAGSRALWRVEPGVVARILFCDGAWCRVSVDGRGGYLARAHGWGTYPGERVQ